VPVVDCGRGERKHEIAEKHLAEDCVDTGFRTDHTLELPRPSQIGAVRDGAIDLSQPRRQALVDAVPASF